MDVRKVERPSEAFGRAAFFFFSDVLRSSQQLLSNPDDCGALPTSNWHRFGSAQTRGYLWHHSHFIFSLSVFLSLLCLPLRSANTSAASSASLAPTKTRPLLLRGLQSLAQICVFPSAVALAPHRGPVPLSPRLRFPPFAGLFCWRFDRRD